MIYVNHENSDNTWLYRVKIEKSPFAPFTPRSLLSQATIVNSLGFIFPNLYLCTYVYICTNIHLHTQPYSHTHMCIHNGFSFENKITLHMFLFFYLSTLRLLCLVRKDKHNIYISFLVCYSFLPDVGVKIKPACKNELGNSTYFPCALEKIKMSTL